MGCLDEVKRWRGGEVEKWGGGGVVYRMGFVLVGFEKG